MITKEQALLMLTRIDDYALRYSAGDALTVLRQFIEQQPDSKPSVQVPDKKSAKDAPIGMFEKEKSAWKTGWNMCRAAMLNQSQEG